MSHASDGNIPAAKRAKQSPPHEELSQLVRQWNIIHNPDHPEYKQYISLVVRLLM